MCACCSVCAAEEWRISSSPPAALNTEGGTYEAGTKNVVLGTESKLLFHWPRANIEAP